MLVTFLPGLGYTVCRLKFTGRALRSEVVRCKMYLFFILLGFRPERTSLKPPDGGFVVMICLFFKDYFRRTQQVLENVLQPISPF